MGRMSSRPRAGTVRRRRRTRRQSSRNGCLKFGTHFVYSVFSLCLLHPTRPSFPSNGPTNRGGRTDGDGRNMRPVMNRRRPSICECAHSKELVLKERKGKRKRKRQPLECRGRATQPVGHQAAHRNVDTWGGRRLMIMMAAVPSNPSNHYCDNQQQQQQNDSRQHNGHKLMPIMLPPPNCWQSGGGAEGWCVAGHQQRGRHGGGAAAGGAAGAVGGARLRWTRNQNWLHP